MSKIYTIQSIPADLLPTMGGKARGLNTLINSGFAVPSAFVVTDVEESDTLDDAVEQYVKLGFDLVSVRSSATVEDGDDYSAAGQFSTFLNVRGADALKQAIRDCVLSLHNSTAEHYKQTFMSPDAAQSKMNVVVQTMVDARCAGVIFTQAPMRAGYTLVEVVPGLGENLVSGKMSAQQYRIKKDFIEDMPDQPILTRPQAISLAHEAGRIEKVFGRPMDLEWAMDRSGHIWWLQARPITVGESVTMNELDCNLAVCESVITTSNIGEVMPGAVTPLNLSTNMYALDWGVMETYRQIGCIPKAAKPFSYISSYYNHMFFNMTNMYQICHVVYGSTKDTMDISICGRELVGYPDIKMPEAPWYKKIHNTRVFLSFVFSGEKAKRGMERTIASFRFDLTKDMYSIYDQILSNFDHLKWTQFYHYCTSYYSGGQSNFLMLSCKSKYPDENDLLSMVAGCLTEMDDFESANILRSMRELATLMVQDNPDTVHYSIDELDDYFTSHAGVAVREAYDVFMRKHGHRGIREMEIRCASWRMNPKSFCQSIKSVLASIGKDEAVFQPAKHWTDYANEIMEGKTGLSRKIIYKLILNARKGVGYREFTKAKIIYALDLYKQAYARLAELMVEAGLLPDTDSIYFLLQDEVGQLLKGDRSLVKKAMARRRLFPQQMDLKFADVCIGIPQPLESIQADLNATRYGGTPVSRGTVTGPARLVTSEEDAALLQPGEIMIAACTDIGWTPYYDIIGGLVTEKGSALSHGIVVAREYALPAVVNVVNAMTNIHTGDTITLDGNTGTVFVNQRAK